MRELIAALADADRNGLLEPIEMPVSFTPRSLDGALSFTWKQTSIAFETGEDSPHARRVLIRVHKAISAVREAMGLGKRNGVPWRDRQSAAEEAQHAL
jgi:hypothetical protein